MKKDKFIGAKFQQRVLLSNGQEGFISYIDEESWHPINVELDEKPGIVIGFDYDGIDDSHPETPRIKRLLNEFGRKK